MHAELRSPRRWFRFSLRTLLVLMAVCGVTLGWQLHVIRERARLRDWLAFRDADVITDPNEFWVYPQGDRPDGTISWYRQMLGDEGVLYIKLRPDVAIEAAARVPATFPEAIVEHDPGNVIIDDRQYAVLKQRGAEERALQKAFDAMFLTATPPTDVDLLEFAPQLAEHLRREAQASVAAEVLTVEAATEYCRTAAEVCERAGKLNGIADADRKAQTQFVADLQLLAAPLAKEVEGPHGAASREFARRLVACQLAECQVREANVSADEREQNFATTVNCAERLCEVAQQALDAEEIEPSSLISSWERRRGARLAASDDAAARSEAWQQYTDAVGQRLAIVERLYELGETGGEAAKYELLRFCAARGAAALARQANDAEGELAAVKAGAASGQLLVAATRAAWEAETITVDQMVDAIQRCAAAQERLTQLQPDWADVGLWQHSHALALFELTSKLRTYHLVSCDGFDAGPAWYVACQYILVRCRMAENSGH